MASAGGSHAVLLRSDGKVFCGLEGKQYGCYKQVSAGTEHSLLITSAGDIQTCGSNSYGQCALPSLWFAHGDGNGPDNLTYIQVSAGQQHSVALRSDGEVVYAGRNFGGSIPPLSNHAGSTDRRRQSSGTVQYFSDNGIRERDGQTVWRGMSGAVVRRDEDGEATIELDQRPEPQWVLRSRADRLQLQGMGSREAAHIEEDVVEEPVLPDLHYVQVSAGYQHTALLRSDGAAFAIGDNDRNQCNLPTEPDYAQVSAGGAHTVLLHKNGHAIAVGDNSDQQCDLPSQDETESAKYVQVSAGRNHTVLLQCDGRVKAVGSNTEGQCDIPCLSPGVSYSRISAGGTLTALLRTDGQVVIAGTLGGIAIPSVLQHQSRKDYLLTRPALPPSVQYVPDYGELPIDLIDGHGVVVVQISGQVVGSECQIRCLGLAGNLLASLDMDAHMTVGEIQGILCEKICMPCWRVQAVLPSGRLMDQCCQHDPFVDTLRRDIEEFKS